MFNEKNCLENLKHIVSEHADDENIKNLSLDELRSSYTQLADNLYHISVSNRLKYKNMLWNIDNLKPEIRSKCQVELFNTWHSIYITSMKTDQIEDLQRSEKQDPPSLTTVEKRPEIDAQKQPHGLIEHGRIEIEKQKTVGSDEDGDLSQKKEPAKKQLRMKASKALVHQYENDWFDKLLDFFAAITGCVSGIFGQ